MRKSLALGFAVAIALAVAFLITREFQREHSEPASPLATEQPNPVPAANPQVIGSIEAESRRSPAESGSADSSTASADEQKAKLIVLARSKKDRSPLAHVRVGVVRKGETGFRTISDVEDSTGDIDFRPVTGTDGRAVLELDAGIAFELHAEGDFISCGAANAEISSLSPGESRTVTVELPSGTDAHLFGAVVADEGGAPIENARVLTSDDSNDGVRTGSDGRFDLELSLWRRPQLTIEAKGFGPAFVVPEPGSGTAEHPIVVRLVRSAALIARIVDLEGRPIPAAKVHLSAKGYESNPTGTFMGTAFLPDEDWSKQVDAEGTCRFDDLPANVPLRAEISVSGRDARQVDAPLSLSPGQVLEREWRMGSGCELTGRVIDSEGAPAPGISIWLVKSAGGNIRRFDRFSLEAKERRTKSKGDGVYEFADVDLGSWLIGPGPEDKQSSIAAFPEIVEVPAAASKVEHDIRVVRGLFIHGRVVDSTDSPEPHAFILASMNETKWFVNANGKEDGTFELGPLVPGEYLVHAMAVMREDASSEPISAKAGDTDVVLKLRAGGSISGRVVDSRTSDALPAEVVLCQQGPGAEYLSMQRTNEDGSFRSAGLPAGTYDVTARTIDGRIGRQLGIVVRAGAESADVVIELLPGAKLNIRYEATSGYGQMHVRCGDSLIAGDGIAAGSMKTVVVPAGHVIVELMSPPQSQEVDLAVGEEKTVVLTGPK
jgi:hypothetical protein